MTVSEFKKEVQALADQVGVQPKEVHVREMKNKWGSCSTRGRLTFNSALLDEPEAKRKEIILHELLHLRYPNHGRMFRSVLRVHLAKA